MMICPICKGNKENFGIGCGSEGCKPMKFKCFQCQGSGKISEQMNEWIKLGKIEREKRRVQNLSLREFAKEKRLSPVQVSDAENGRIDPIILWKKF